MDINNMTIGVVDIETTGFFKDGGTIVEVGIVKLNTKTGEREIIFNSICKEKRFSELDRKSWIFSNSDLKFEDVQNAKWLMVDLFDDIQNALDSCDALTAYNKAFDFEFLRDRGFKIKNEVSCPMLAATPIIKLPPKWRSYRRSGYKWPKVQEAYDFFFEGNDYVEEHRGADDALHEAEILMELIKLNAIEIEV